MSGRFESEIKARESMKNKLADMPEYMHDYYDYLHTKSYSTRKDYVLYTFAFLKYLENNGKSISASALKNITSKDINRYFSDVLPYHVVNGAIRPTSSSYQALVWSALKKFFMFLIPEYISENPILCTERPKVIDDVNKPALKPNEITEVVKIINKNESASTSDKNDLVARNMLLFFILIKTGARIGAVREIDLSDIDEKNKRVRLISKGNKVKNYEIDDVILEYYRRWLPYRQKLLKEKDSDALFISEKGNRLSYEAIRKLFIQYSKGLDLHITPHTTRRTVATIIYKESGDLNLVQEKLDHADIRTSKKYLEKSDEYEKKATDILNEKIDASINLALKV